MLDRNRGAWCAGLALCCSFPLSHAAPDELTVEAALDLAKKVRPQYAKPARTSDWLDETHFLGVDAPSGGGPKQPVIVDVKSWDRVALLDRAQVYERMTGVKGATEAQAQAVSDAWLGSAAGSALFDFQGDLFVRDSSAGRVVRLTNDSADEELATLAPSGQRVAFVRDNDLYVATLSDPPAVRALTTEGDDDTLCGKLDWVYQEEVYGRGNFQGYFWSPDSRFLAYLELDLRDVLKYTIVDHRKRRPDVEVWPYPKAGDPNPRAALVVVEVATGKRARADLSAYTGEDTLLVRVQWTPDSQSVLLQVQDRRQRWLDLLALDPATGASTKLFREQGALLTEPTDAPFFLKDGSQFVWFSERDGFRHLYLYGRDGKLLQALTHGEYEVDSVARVTDKGEVFYVSDQDDVKGAQLYRLDIATGTSVRVTSRAGTHAVAVSPQGAYTIDEWSSLVDPGDVSVIDSTGTKLRPIADANREVLGKYDLGKAEFVKFEARDGYPLEAFVIKPKGFDPSRKYPVFSFAYAGPHAPQALDRFYNRDVFWFHYLASQGYLVWVCDNRSASGRGQISMKGVVKNLGSEELRDLEDGIDWLVKQGYADPSRIALHGWSYGGYMTAFALTHSTKFKVGISGAPVTDWSLYDSIYTERYMDLPASNVAGYEASSVLRAAQNLSGHLLLIHGVIDENVHMQNSLQFVEALQRAGKQFDLMLYPGNRHSVQDPKQRVHLYETMTRFLREHL